MYVSGQPPLPDPNVSPRTQCSAVEFKEDIKKTERRSSLSNYTRRSSISSQKSISWIKSFAKSDPRWKIMRFFQNFVMQHMAKRNELLYNPALSLFGDEKCAENEALNFRPSVFSVWRTTNMDAIRMMMTGKGTGKGLDIKGKSAIRGKLSGFVPFVQIHNKDEDKKKVGTCPSNTRVRIFFASKRSRDEACVHLKRIMLEMIKELKIAKESISVPGIDPEEYEVALQKMIWKMTNPRVIKVDDYAPKTFGVDIPERLLWEAYIIRGDCTRVKGSEMDTGRPSEPQFFFMNLHATRNAKSTPRAVVFQNDEENPMDPMSLLMAYEENGNVVPVVSDFDPFLIGTRGIPYEEPLENEQVKIMKWCVNEIEGLLKLPKINGGWVKNWLRILKKATKQGFDPVVPRYGFGDPMSYSIVESAVGSLQSSGAVRHGSECFNYYFPQAIDEEYLIICPEYFGDLPYKYVNQHELRQFLIEKVNLGFTFPLHPKWVLCDPGWIQVWKELTSSNLPYVQESLNVWYPPESGIREKINEVSLLYPDGFMRDSDGMSTIATMASSTEERDLALLELKRYMTLQRAKRKLRIITSWMSLHRKAKEQREKKDAEGDSAKKSEEFTQKEAELEVTGVKLLLKSTDLKSRENALELKEKATLEKLENKENELEKKEKSLIALKNELDSKRQILENMEGNLKSMESFKVREHKLELQEVDLKVRESRLELMELEMEMKLKKLIARENGKKSKRRNPIKLELKEIEIWRKESELEFKEVEIKIRSEKLSAREKEVALQETQLKIPFAKKLC